VHANVGFAQCGADAIPVEPGMVDGVVFSYSFHHIPAEQYQDVLSEWQRILKPDGFVYVIEPVAAGDLNEIMRLFHDEQAVRAKAEDVLNTSAAPMFENVNVIRLRSLQTPSGPRYLMIRLSAVRNTFGVSIMGSRPPLRIELPS